MGRKSSAKQVHGTSGLQNSRGPQGPRDSQGGINPLVWVAVALAVVIGAVVVMRSGNPAVSSADPSASTEAGAKPAVEASPEAVARAATNAGYGPHRQQNLPPIPFQAYQPPRSHEVTTAAFHFAAEHPEIASYVPCFCGCEQAGHEGNHACFVKSRAPNGDVVEWEPHGIDCAVCIDVATRSRQLHASGASARDIRAAIEREFKPLSQRMTPTPNPPGTSAAAEEHVH